ncbi:LysR family transcriptional regulator [Mesorhizobium sp. NBSH29]|uniref:LysR family transcriptional regulator n=1 Tax=Mesorhizobium sp. NBSH29 TaxID=2654249 RepID=UPI00189692E5|nr:LysR family transcriptional regulator [Mesorhizobium sp. NBSH29]QPC85575.1 LysR family transcriptional regulator [Mesorhizobium sp. NBSH29]
MSPSTLSAYPSSGDDEGLLRSGLKLRHMRLTVALEEHGQISAAAQVMNISQPAASRLISEIEAILGVDICVRLPRGVQLTPYGVALARRARSILLEMREVDREISDLKRGRGGSVFLGSVTAPAIDLAVPAIRKIRQQHPRIEISVQVETSAVLARELLASRHDFMIGRIPDDLNPRLFESRIIGVEKACLIARRGHPLSTGRKVSLEELAKFDWVFQPRGSLLRQTVEGIFVSQGAPLPDRVLNTSSLLLTLVMVAQSDAIAPIAVDVARFVNSRAGLSGAIDILPIAFDINVQPYSLIKVRDRTLSPAAELMYEQILREI